MTNNRPVNVAFVGVGEFITGNHLPNLSEADGFVVKWLCDLNPQILADRAGRFSVQATTTDMREILADPEVDLVIIGTRQDTRVKLIQACAAAGKDVFVEKPMSLTCDESHAIIRAIRASGSRLQVGYNRRYAPATQAAKQVYDEIRKTERKPAIITYRAVDESFLWPDWAFDESHGGKVFHEGCHFFDLACFFTDSRPISIYTAGEIRDNQVTTLTFPDGTIFNIINSGEGSNGYPKERMEIFCAWNTIIMDHFIALTVVRQDSMDERMFPLFRDRGRLSDEVCPPDEFLRRNVKWRGSITREEFEHRHYYGSTPIVDKGHLAQFQVLADAISGQKPFPCNEIDGAIATYLCEACIESINTGKVVSLDYDWLTD